MTMQRFTSIFTVFFLAVFTAFSLTSAPETEVSSTELPVLKSEHTSLLNETKSKITIKCNVPDASVFLNGQFEGNTEIEISDLTEGRYILRVEKAGYEPKKYRIHVNANQSEIYYVELEKYQGLVIFQISPEDGFISINGERCSYTSINLPEGEHLVIASKFGYKSQTKKITVVRNTQQTLNFDLLEEDFSIKDFSVNRTKFNPALPHSAGNLKFSFYVTNKADTVFTVTNQKNEAVFSTKLPEFSTWQQEYTWDGILSDGTTVSDGKYTATINAGDINTSLTFTVDSSIRLPVSSITPSGNGLGNIPMAFQIPENFIVLGANTGIDISDENNDKVYGVPVSAFFTWSPFEHLELTVRGGAFTGFAEETGFYSTAAKIAFTEKFSSFNFDWGFLFRFGGCTNHPFEPYGADTGSGAGGGLLLGIEKNHFYMGTSTELTYGTSTYSTSEYDTVLRNGFAVQYNLNKFSMALYGALNSSYGTTNLPDDDRSDSSLEIFRAVETGADISLRPFDELFYINLRGNILIFKNKTYYRTEMGFSFVL